MHYSSTPYNHKPPYPSPPSARFNGHRPPPPIAPTYRDPYSGPRANNYRPQYDENNTWSRIPPPAPIQQMSVFNQNQNRRATWDGQGSEWDRDRGGPRSPTSTRSPTSAYPTRDPPRSGYDARAVANSAPRDSGSASHSISRRSSPNASSSKAGSGDRRRRSRTPDKPRTHSHSRSHSVSSSDVASSRASPAPQPPAADKAAPTLAETSQRTVAGEAVTADQSKSPAAVKSGTTTQGVLVLSDLKQNITKLSESSTVLDLSDLKQKPSESSRDGTDKAPKAKALDVAPKPERTYSCFPSLSLSPHSICYIGLI